MMKTNYVNRVKLILSFSLVIALASCNYGGDQPPVERTVYFNPPANFSWVPPIPPATQPTRVVSFDMLMKIATTNSNRQPMTYPGGPIRKSFSTVPPNASSHFNTISEQIEQPEGATAFVISLDLNSTECGQQIHGGNVTNAEKGAKGSWDYTSEQIAYPHNHAIPPNRLRLYQVTQCP